MLFNIDVKDTEDLTQEARQRIAEGVNQIADERICNYIDKHLAKKQKQELTSELNKNFLNYMDRHTSMPIVKRTSINARTTVEMIKEAYNIFLGSYTGASEVELSIGAKSNKGTRVIQKLIYSLLICSEISLKKKPFMARFKSEFSFINSNSFNRVLNNMLKLRMILIDKKYKTKPVLLINNRYKINWLMHYCIYKWRGTKWLNVYYIFGLRVIVFTKTLKTNNTLMIIIYII